MRSLRLSIHTWVKTPIRHAIVWTSSLLFLSVLVGCSKEAPSETEPRPVVTIKVPAAGSSVARTFSGSLRAAQGTTLSFEVAGRVVDVPAVNGKEFQKGKLLARIDCTQYEASLKDARAQLRRTQENLKRRQLLFENGNASKQELDSALAEAASMSAAEERAAKQVADCDIRMPYDGVVSQVLVDQQQAVSVGTAAVRVQGTAGMEIVIGVPENLITRISPGLTASVLVSAISEKEFAGVVTEISQAPSDAGTFETIVKLSSDDERLRQGMAGVARFQLELDNTNTLSVPFEAVVGSAGKQRFVWIVKPQENGLGKVERRTVTVGEIVGGDRIQILEGLEPGELLVTRGVHLIDDGLLVKIIA